MTDLLHTKPSQLALPEPFCQGITNSLMDRKWHVRLGTHNSAQECLRTRTLPSPLYNNDSPPPTPLLNS
ncbi:hypothetical protein LDENG_00103400 [Lucifuga dentata]|nr:hypothetical protein LDENG_00103400 [Lucifuga dentata]